MQRVRKLRARPLVAVLAVATGVVVTVGRLGLRRRRGGERRSSVTEENKRISRRSVDEIFNQGNLEVAEELYAPDFIGYDPALPDPMRGPEGIKQQAEGYRAAFSDMRLTIDDEIAEGDRVVTRWTARGTHDGELFGIPATGKQSTVVGMTIDRIIDGRIVESWNSWDTLGLLQQLGAVPELAQT
jgi:steroid delta-isomerase-like uncharacterized protein